MLTLYNNMWCGITTVICGDLSFKASVILKMNAHEATGDGLIRTLSELKMDILTAMNDQWSDIVERLNIQVGDLLHIEWPNSDYPSSAIIYMGYEKNSNQHIFYENFGFRTVLSPDTFRGILSKYRDAI